MEQLNTIGQKLAMDSQGGFGQSKEFLDLVKSIGKAGNLSLKLMLVPLATHAIEVVEVELLVELGFCWVWEEEEENPVKYESLACHRT